MVFFVLFCFLQDEELIVDDIKIDYVETVTFVSLPLKVQHRGRPYKQLDLDDITVIENGVRVELEDLRKVKTPLTIHFLFDLSTSNERHLMFAKRAVFDVTDRLAANDRVKLSFFSASYQPVTEYTSDATELRQKMLMFRGVGSTALYDGISEALHDMNTVSGSRALVVFSDGIDLISRSSQEDLENLVRNYRIPIVFVGFSKKKKSAPLLAEQLVFMENLVRASGGQVIDGTHGHSRELQSAIRELRFRYLVRFSPPGPEDLDQWRSLEVQIANCAECSLDYRRAYQLQASRN